MVHDCCERALQQRLKLKREEYMKKTLPTHTEILSQLIELINNKLPPQQAKMLADFANIYYLNVPVEDLQDRSLNDLFGNLLSHWKLVTSRKQGENAIRIFNPHLETDGWQSRHTVIEIASRDMPFLVDSLRMEILREGFRIYFIIHTGGLMLVRDKDYQVTDVLPLHSAKEKNAAAEATIYIEIDRRSDPKVLEKLREKLALVLEDVRLTVDDWSAMRERMQEALSELDQNPPPYDQADIAESKDFLRWLDNDHFTYLGCRDYQLVGEGDKEALCIVPGSGLGVLRNESKSKTVRPLSSLPAAARELALAEQVLVISKTNTKSTVHRPVYTDYIGIKRFDKKGKLIGEHRFIGLYTSTAYNSHPKDIPFLRHKVDMVVKKSQLSAAGHAGKELMDILVSIPRDDLFQASIEELTNLSLGILHIQERHRIRLFVRRDAYQRFVSCLVYIPADIYDSELGATIQKILMDAFHGLEVSVYPVFSEAPLARIHFLIRTDPNQEIKYDVKEVEAKLIAAGRSWKDDLREYLVEHYGDENGNELALKYEKAFPASYREDFLPRTAVYDIEHIEKLSPVNTLELSLQRSVGEGASHLRFKLFQTNNPVILSDVLPMLENMGLRVIEERAHEIVLNGGTVWINDFDMICMVCNDLNIEKVKGIFQDAFQRIWLGEAENDGFNRLILAANLTWREAALLRAYTKYFRQIGFTFSQAYIEDAVTKNAEIARLLVQLFELQFDPKRERTAITLAEFIAQIKAALIEVVNLDEDRILRRFLEVMRATLRTNYFQTLSDGEMKTWFSFKLEPGLISDLPLPRPLYEIFVYSPRVEGIHLRAAKVARGGLRWSDRREDFRTEVLGLMKAQQVKNAVIVPAGAKGGFVVKAMPVNASRDVIQQEVVSCYQTFIRGLLDLTDNLQNGLVIPPLETVRYDGDDPYLVVAADKGTATFSDIANSIAQAYGFWLDDAFASGGSTGYDHKKIGITARGAWESVKRHFRALAIDPEHQAFTVVGIGDMSGDVFGNGMLRSKQIKLVAAFNHQHIFLDPDPDPALSFAERERLFKLPRSTWEDYNPSLISNGGGVYNRAAKSIFLTPEIKQLLELNQDTIEPDTLISAILKAPVDLLWNGGIGTYVKSSQEKNNEVGDRTNDAVRVNGIELRCRSVGEGGNLGFTQLSRIEYAHNGGLIYTDFIDNSAGVDCSDHEVNTKILLNMIVADGDLTFKQRNQLLVEMTDAVADLVLRDNYNQTRAISLMVAHSGVDMELYRRYISDLEHAGKLNRELEFLPDDKILLDRKMQSKGLTAPEVAILLAYTKIITKAELLESDIFTDPYLTQALEKAFPEQLRQRFYTQMQLHNLRREIIATGISNDMVNDLGVLFVYRMKNETGSSLADIVRAYVIAQQIFSLPDLFQLVEDLNHNIPLELCYQILAETVRLVRRAARWFLRNRKSNLHDIAGTITLFRQGVLELNGHLPDLLIGDEKTEWQERVETFVNAGIPEKIAPRLATVQNQYALLDIVAAAIENEFTIKDVAQVYFAIGEFMEFAWLREKLTKQPVKQEWDAMARATLRDDLDTQQRNLAISVLRTTDKIISVDQQIEIWAQRYAAFVERWQKLLGDIRTIRSPDFIMYAVIIRELVELIRYHKAENKRAKSVKAKVTQ